jgi:hypothetical protein
MRQLTRTPRDSRQCKQCVTANEHRHKSSLAKQDAEYPRLFFILAGEFYSVENYSNYHTSDSSALRLCKASDNLDR